MRERGKGSPNFRKHCKDKGYLSSMDRYVWSKENTLASILWILGFLLLFHSLTLVSISKHILKYIFKEIALHFIIL